MFASEHSGSCTATVVNCKKQNPCRGDKKKEKSITLINIKPISEILFSISMNIIHKFRKTQES